jgi:hypothetical protein
VSIGCGEFKLKIQELEEVKATRQRIWLDLNGWIRETPRTNSFLQ